MIRIVLLAGVIATLSLPVHAADEARAPASAKPLAASFESLDKDADMQISKKEAAADKHLKDAFASADTNGDGYLSKAEFAAQQQI